MMHLAALSGERRQTCVLVLIAFLGIILPTASAFATSPSPVGQWETVSDETGEATSIVRITLENGELVGRVEQLMRGPGKDPNPLCSACPDEKKGKPVLGMTILWGHKERDDNWDGGFILQPKSGKTFRSEVRVTDNNGKLEVRGYIGVSVFGRTQVWIRTE